MSQSQPAESDNHGELDPLLAFNAEIPELPTSAEASTVAEASADRSVGKPPIESESSVAPLVPAPTAVPPTPAVELQTVANVVPPPVREAVGRESARPVTYLGTLSIDSAPAGEVFINPQSVGKTPVRAENLRAGSHLI